MTREEIIEQLDSIIGTYEILMGNGVNSDILDVDDIEAIREAISALSENKGEWIPVSERLPEEENKRYWICTDCGYQCECRWTNVNPFWTYLTTDWHWNIMDVPQYSKVVAWMPLPEPYKKGGE